MKSFAAFHPSVLLCYFTVVIGLTMFTTNPLLLAISIVNSLIVACIMAGTKVVRKSLAYSLFMFLIVSITNPLFTHNGLTVLFFINDKPITLESFYYGVAIATMLVAVIYWFHSLNQLLTSEKIIYLFGKVTPAFALMLSMTLGLIPKAKKQMKNIKDTQKTMGIDTSSGRVVARLKSGMRIMSILITWLLENGVDTANSMRARGYGLRGRTAYSPYRFTKQDATMLSIITVLFLFVIITIINGANDFYYYPTTSITALTPESVAGAFAFCILSALPIIVQIKEVF